MKSRIRASEDLPTMWDNRPRAIDDWMTDGWVASQGVTSAVGSTSMSAVLVPTERSLRGCPHHAELIRAWSRRPADCGPLLDT